MKKIHMLFVLILSVSFVLNICASSSEEEWSSFDHDYFSGTDSEVEESEYDSESSEDECVDQEMCLCSKCIKKLTRGQIARRRVQQKYRRRQQEHQIDSESLAAVKKRLANEELEKSGQVDQTKEKPKKKKKNSKKKRKKKLVTEKIDDMRKPDEALENSIKVFSQDELKSYFGYELADLLLDNNVSIDHFAKIKDKITQDQSLLSTPATEAYVLIENKARFLFTFTHAQDGGIPMITFAADGKEDCFAQLQNDECNSDAESEMPIGYNYNQLDMYNSPSRSINNSRQMKVPKSLLEEVD